MEKRATKASVHAIVQKEHVERYDQENPLSDYTREINDTVDGVEAEKVITAFYTIINNNVELNKAFQETLLSVFRLEDEGPTNRIIQQPCSRTPHKTQ